jgi:hypothetical protein
MLAKENNENLYLLAIVGIVAVVGIVVMILNSDSKVLETSMSESDLTGQPARAVDKYGKTPGMIYPGETKPYQTPEDDDTKEDNGDEKESDDKDDDDTGASSSGFKGNDCPKGVVC